MNRQPLIIGLPIQLFYIFIMVVVVAVFMQIGGLSLIKFLSSLLLLVASYVGLKFLGGDALNSTGNEKFPDNIMIDNIK